MVVVLAALVGPTLITTRPPAPAPSATAAAVNPTSGPASAPVATLGPSPTLEPWPDLAVPAFAPLAELVPTETDRAGVATGSSFVLRSLTATPAIELARGLRIDPPTGFDVDAGATADIVVIRPVERLIEGLRYRFRLETPDGALAGTWAFHTRAPLRVVGTLPGHQAVEVPLNTGIEVTFDQDDSTGVSEHFTIEPAVAGRLEAHGRTWAFIPAQPLAEATIYTVTIGRGVGITGSTEILAADEVFRFETGKSTPQRPRIRFSRAMLEVRPDTLPVVLVDGLEDKEASGSTPAAIGVTIHRLPTFAAVVSAATTLAGPDGWAIASASAVVPTAGLTLVADVNGTLVSSDFGGAIQIPVRLAPGSYIATITQLGAPSQLLLQVTNLSAYALTATEDTIVWVNDLASDKSIANATISTGSGRSLGKTNADGLLRVATPDQLTGAIETDTDFDLGLERSAFLLSVFAPDGRRLVVPIGLTVGSAYRESASWYEGYTGNRWWQLFQTDRTVYRQTDIVHVFGTIRARADRSVPEGIEIRLRPSQGSPEAPILRVPVSATGRGVFTADLRLQDLPRATYTVDLFVGRERVSSTWISVTEIRKPAYRIEVETDRHVYLVGDQVRITARASFYDGTPVPDMQLRFSLTEQSDETAEATTNAIGEATVVLRVALTQPASAWFAVDIDVAPVHPEEGQVAGSDSAVGFPARTWLNAKGTVSGDRIVLSGTLSLADLAGFEAALAAGTSIPGDGDAEGKVISGGSVEASISHLVPVRRQIGTTYDFIEKKVVPTYEYDVNEVAMGSSTLTTATDGSFKLSMAAPVPEDSYQITLTAVDPEGRKFIANVYASRPSADGAQRQPYLAPRNPANADGENCDGSVSVRGGLDTDVTLALHEGNGDIAADGRYLFLVGRLGSLDATLLPASTFSRVMREADLPNITVRVVRLSGSGYVVADAQVLINPADKTISIRLQPDRASYRPGDPVKMDITTTDPAGRPVSADVVVKGIDEKLYALGHVQDLDPLDALLATTQSGFLQAYRSHAIPIRDYGGCGAEGGGERDDFLDTVTFQRISTDAAGRGVVAFDLSDDVTSWHMSAVAVSGRLEAGSASVLIPVGLPFFVDAVLAPEFLTGDQPILRLRAYGGLLAATDRVQFVVESPTLGLAPTKVDGAAFAAIRLALPAMTAGEHAIRITATVSHAGTTLRDSLIRTVRVVDSRLGSLAASYELVQPGFVPLGGEGLTTYVITDAGRGRLISLLDELASSQSARFDRSAAAELARKLLIEEYVFPDGALAATGYAPDRYEQNGITLLPYGSADLFLSAKAALVARSLVNVELLREGFAAWLGDENAQRERRIAAYAGLAAIGDDVLEELRGFDVAALTVREQLWLGLGLAAAGDDAAARAIERILLDTSGQRLGPWVRLGVGTTLDESLEASGLLLLLAARLGDPLAHDVSRYLVDHPSKEFVFPLEQMGYVQSMLEWLPRVPGRFAWTVGGERHEIDLAPGGAYSLVLTRAQRASLALERLAGELGVVTTYTATDAPLPSDSTVTVKRTVTPAGGSPSDGLVRVQFEITFGPAVTGGCYRLTDILPSGLAPVAATGGSSDSEEPATLIYPYESDGQRVSWCVEPSERSAKYGYAARVVSPGTYRWEPAVLQSEAAPSVGSSTAATTYVIR
ncbi:MAG: Ig-like domain-containing protein [Candidatus Limnocylindrales bacterium]